MYNGRMLSWFRSGDPDEWKPFVAIVLTAIVMLVVAGMLAALMINSF